MVQAAIFSMPYEPHSIVTSTKLLNNLRCTIRTSVIHNDYLEVLKTLIYDAGNTCLKKACGIISRDNDRNQWHRDLKTVGVLS